MDFKINKYCENYFIYYYIAIASLIYVYVKQTLEVQQILRSWINKL